MRTKIAGGWRKILPHFKQNNVWRKGEHLFSKVGGQWKDVSEPGDPKMFDLNILPVRSDTYGERYVYVNFYNPPGQVSDNRLSLYDPSKIITTIEWGANDYVPGGPWRWLTFTLSGDETKLPWPQIGMFNDIPLHFVSNVWLPQYGTTRVWYRTYRDLPQNQNQHRILI